MNMKRILSLALMALLLCLPVWAMAEKVTLKGINYELSGNTASVAKYTDDTKYIGDVVIPATIEVNGTTYPVSQIQGEAFWYCTDLTSISIPNSVTSIEESAFEGCTSLTSVTLPNSVTSIGDWAFLSCSSLTDVEIPSSVESIGGRAFLECAFETVTIPASVKSLGNYVFSSNPMLARITFEGAAPEFVRSDDDINAQVSYELFLRRGALKEICVPHESLSAYKAGLGQSSQGLVICAVHGASCGVAVDLPQTGDESNILLWSALACISVIGMMTLVRKRKEA